MRARLLSSGHRCRVIQLSRWRSAASSKAVRVNRIFSTAAVLHMNTRTTPPNALKDCDRCHGVSARSIADNGMCFVACECGRVGPDSRNEASAIRAWNVMVSARPWRPRNPES